MDETETPKPPSPDTLIPHVTMDPRAERRMALKLCALLLPLLALGVMVHAALEPQPAAVISASLSESADADLVEIRDARGAVLLSAEFRSRVDSLGNIEKDAELTDQKGETVIGEVELEFPAAGREHRRPELEVDVINLQPRQRYTVVIDDRTVGTFLTDDRGSADLELQEGETFPGSGAQQP